MNGRRTLLAASIISIQNSSFVYPSCQNCLSKLILDSKRFNCLKCGCTGEAKDAHYRYRLCLKVADTDDLFDITIFGSSLDPFFGVTAKSLQRCIQDFNQESGELDRNASPSMLVQAVKTCFVGRRFIFGVKSSENHDGGHFVSDNILQNCSKINRLARDLTACQIFLPRAAVAGFTVIGYFRRLLQSAYFRSSHSSSHRPDCPLIGIDQPSSELSSLCSSGSNSSFVPSSGRESFPGLWQQSFGLISSSVDWVTAEDSSSLELGKISGEQGKSKDPHFSAELSYLSLRNQTIQDLHLCNSVNEKSEQEDNKIDSLPSQSVTVTANGKQESFSSLRREWSPDRNQSRWLQSPLDLGIKYACPEIISRHDHFQENSWNSFHYPREDDSFCSSAVSPNHGSAAGTSQHDPMIWDELPFSESLNEFLARIENNSTISPVGFDVHKCSPQERGELDKNHSRTSCRQDIVVVDLQAVCTTGRFPQIAENPNICKDHILSCHQSNLTPIGGPVTQWEPLYSILSTSTKGGKESEFIPNSPLLVLSQSSAVTAKMSLSQGSFLQSGEANVKISNNAHSFTSLQCTMKEAGSLYKQWREEPARLHSLNDGCTADWENKENSSYPLTPRTDLTNSQELGCDSAIPIKAKNMLKRELKPLTKLQENTVRAINQNDLLQNANFPTSSYNASADLFDASTRERKTFIEFSNKSPSFSAQEDVLTARCRASELMLSPLDVGCSSPEYSSSPNLPLLFSKHSTPLTYSLYDSELDLGATQNFVPSSQSTPVIRPFQKFRSQRGRDSIILKLTSKSPTKIHCRCKQARYSFKNTLLRQLTSKFPKCKRSNNTTINKSVPQQQSTNSEWPENDTKEWVPPSATKLSQPISFSNLKTVGLPAGSPAMFKFIDQKTISENNANNGKPRTDTCLKNRKLNSMNNARIPTAPIPVTDALLPKDEASGTCACSETKKSQSCATYLLTGLDEAVSWSPELFKEKYHF
ncbi:DNA damage-induced apoptosis suppressor protein [Carettochelys insculpta]|uniref:DNA damage-induced apoptosis suppressor protein n=1 Tax=Carettochelys insculpta TaxID=44489 RepID=UPI003EBEFAF1